ncbi:MAG: hypothetical protein AVDCRST_MAG76-579, partial [uncultured Acidimicrobiales bacterium]
APGAARPHRSRDRRGPPRLPGPGRERAAGADPLLVPVGRRGHSRRARPGRAQRPHRV